MDVTIDNTFAIIMALRRGVQKAQADGATHINLDELRQEINEGEMEALHQAIQAQG